jgi:hypothetical protein
MILNLAWETAELQLEFQLRLIKQAKDIWKTADQQQTLTHTRFSQRFWKLFAAKALTPRITAGKAKITLSSNQKLG